jgi:hypothetical protein
MRRRRLTFSVIIASINILDERLLAAEAAGAAAAAVASLTLVPVVTRIVTTKATQPWSIPLCLHHPPGGRLHISRARCGSMALR